MTARRTAPRLALLLRPLLLVAAALALVGTGGVELSPRTPGAPAVSVLASSTTRAAAPASAGTEATPAVPVLRAALAPTAPPAPGGAALPPGTRPLVAPHLVGAPQTRPPTSRDLLRHPGVPDGRAPPLATGT